MLQRQYLRGAGHVAVAWRAARVGRRWGVALEAPSVVNPQSYCFILCEHTDRNGWSRGAQERSGPSLTEEGAGEERVRAPEERVGLRERRSGATARASEARSRRAVARVQERCMACNGKRLSTRCVHARQYVCVRSESADVATLLLRSRRRERAGARTPEGRRVCWSVGWRGRRCVLSVSFMQWRWGYFDPAVAVLSSSVYDDESRGRSTSTRGEERGPGPVDGHGPRGKRQRNDARARGRRSRRESVGGRRRCNGSRRQVQGLLACTAKEALPPSTTGV